MSESESLVSAHIRVTGMVQGVFYRRFVQTYANQLGLNGWVKNCPDGSVEAEAVGPKGLVQDLLKQMKIGPPASHVAGCTVEWDDWEGASPDGFSIRW